MATWPMWHGRSGFGKGRATPVALMGIRPRAREPRRISFVLPPKCSCIKSGGRLSFAEPWRAMRLFYGHEAVHAGPGRGVIVFTAGRCGVDGQSRILPSGQDDSASRGKSADDGECYNPTLSCANRDFMLFRMSRGSNPVLHEAQREGNREGKNFFIWIRCNPLKSPEFRQEIQGNPSLFSCFYLDLLGFIWTPS